MNIAIILLIAYLTIGALAAGFALHLVAMNCDILAPRCHCLVIFALDVLFMGGVTFFVLDDTAQRLHTLQDKGAPRAMFWLGGMASFMAVTVLAGTGTLQTTKMSSYQSIDHGSDYERNKDMLTSLLLLPVVVVGSLGVTAHVILRASSTGELEAKGGLSFEAWSSLLVAGCLWCLLQACVVAIVQRGHRFGLAAFATAMVSAVMPFMSGAFDTAKDLCFTALALHHGDQKSHAIGWVSLALVVIVHVCMLATDGGRFELRNTFLSVFSLVPDDHAVEGAKAGSIWDKLGLMLVKQTTPDRLLFLVLEDAPQGILTVCFSITTSTFSPWLIGVNIVIPLIRICVAKFTYSRIISQGFVLQSLVQVLSKGATETTRQWTLAQFENAIKLNGADRISRNTIKAHAEATGKDEHSACLYIVSLMPELDEEEGLFTSPPRAPLMLMAMLSPFLEANTTRMKLDLCEKEVCDVGAAALAKGLEANATLQTLALWQNKIGDEGAVALATALEANATLQTLGLRQNKIGDEGAVALATALEANASLEELNLHDNCIGDKGASAFAELLKSAKCPKALLVLDLSDNDISDSVKEALKRALEAVKVQGREVCLNLR